MGLVVSCQGVADLTRALLSFTPAFLLYPPRVPSTSVDGSAMIFAQGPESPGQARASSPAPPAQSLRTPVAVRAYQP